jgi:hypothetical protein
VAVVSGLNHKNKRKQRSVAIAASVKSQAKPTSDLKK